MNSIKAPNRHYAPGGKHRRRDLMAKHLHSGALASEILQTILRELCLATLGISLDHLLKGEARGFTIS